MTFHLYKSSLIYFSNVLTFSVYKPFPYLIKFVSQYFILFGAIVNGIIFSIDHGLFVFILYPATLLNFFISCNFLIELLAFLYIKSCHLQAEIILLLPKLSPFNLFLWTIALTRTYNTMLNRICEMKHAYLIPDPRGEIFQYLTTE